MTAGSSDLSAISFSQESRSRDIIKEGHIYIDIFSIPLQAWNGPEGSRKLRFPDFMTTAQEGGKVVSHTHRPHLPPGNSPGTHFCSRLSRPQGHNREDYVNEKFQ